MVEKTKMLKTNSDHEVHTIITGDDSKIPVVILHGGPGSKSKDYHRAIYDFDQVYTIQIDQRGCGESTPQGKIENNTTADLLSDLELVRKELNIDKWIVSGGSWGSTLALLYAEKHPNAVLGLFLSNIFLARKRDQRWLLREGGASRFFPDVWDKVQKKLDENNISRENTYEHMLEILNGDNFEDKQRVTSIVGGWEGNLMTLETNFEYSEPKDITEEDINGTKIFIHYDLNDYFIEDNQIQKNINNIRNIPTYIVHGRYDVVCPPEQAFLLHKNLNNSVLEFTNFDGHKLNNESKRLMSYMFREFLTKLDI